MEWVIITLMALVAIAGHVVLWRLLRGPRSKSVAEAEAREEGEPRESA